MNDVEVCPICRNPYGVHNPKVQYHIQYKPIPEYISACQSCNHAEYLSRHWTRHLKPWQWERIKLVRKFKKENGFEYTKPKSKMLTIIFEAHGTTFDNEAHLSSGHNDVELSPLGIQQSKEMGERYKDDHFDAIFCSDLQRAYKSAEIGFGNKWLIIKDARLRECNYGDFTQHPSEEVDKQKPLRITEPFPNGESYTETTARMKSFLDDLKRDYEGKRIMIIGHRATQYGLDHLINSVPLEQLVFSHFKWQPGWEYNV